MGGRFATLIAVIFGVYACLLVHLYDVQINHRSFYSAKAASQDSGSTNVAARGTIYLVDKDGNRLPAALEKDYPLIYAVPREVTSTVSTADQLALLMRRPADTFLKLLSSRTSNYALLDKNPDPDLVKKITETKLPGIYVKTASRRFYPFSTLASQVVGFVGPNEDNNGESGKYGIEKSEDANLSGGIGQDVTLTIDPAIQTEAEHIIKNLAASARAKGASVIVADPKTGKILAMGATPSFDPNNYTSSSISSFSNPLIEQIYEPGSVFKVLTMVAGIDTGSITPNTTFDDTGTLVVNGHTIHNWDLRGHGVVTMTQVIDDSINTGAAFAERQTGNETFKNYLQKLGFAQKSGVDMPGELTGSLATLTPKAPAINYATASFGQGVSATPIQVLQAISSIANGGLLMKPYVNAASEPQVIRRVMSADTAKKVSGMMVNAVDTAKVTTIEGYSVAGKTGTAQVPDFGHGGYTTNVIDTYVGYAPAYDPKFIALIKLNEPYGAPHAAETVVPAFHNLAQFLINYLNVPPDRIGANTQ